MRILISGASIAGPVLAYWLTRRGLDVTVVERAPALRKTGGHAVDLFRPAMEISEQMGVLARIEERATGTTVLTCAPAVGGHSRRVSTTSSSSARSPTGTSRSCATTSARSTTTRAATTSSTCSATRSRPSPTTARHVRARRATEVRPHRRRRRTALRGTQDRVRRRRAASGSSAAISRWCRCRNRLPATARWTGTSNPTGSRWSTPPTTSTMRGRCSCSGRRSRWTTTTGTSARQQDQLRAAFSRQWPREVDRWLAGARAHTDVLLRRDHPAGADQLVAGSRDARRRRRLLPRPRGRGQHQPRRLRRVRPGRRNREGGWRSRRRLRRATNTR